MSLYELKRYREMIMLLIISSNSNQNGGRTYEELRQEAIDYLDNQTNEQFDRYKEKDENGKVIEKNKVLCLTLFK